MRSACLLLILVATSAGCTHRQLARSSQLQASSITDLQYQQVLSNLASFHCTPDVLPHFSVVGTGGTSVSDQGSASLELEWDTAALARKMLGLDASREVQEQWTLAPVVHPDKLRAIRCAFQLVTQGCANDPEADTLLTSFLGSHYHEWIQQGWYGCGGRRDVPKEACYVAHQGDLYVWVTPDGVDGLSRLTIVILNIATLDPAPTPAEPTKTVQEYKYVDGRLMAIETYTRPDSDAPKASPPAIRRDFYNPIQSQIQMQQSGGR